MNVNRPPSHPLSSLFHPQHIDHGRIAAYEERVFQRPLGDKSRNRPPTPPRIPVRRLVIPDSWRQLY